MVPMRKPPERTKHQSQLRTCQCWEPSAHLLGLLYIAGKVAKEHSTRVKAPMADLQRCIWVLPTRGPEIYRNLKKYLLIWDDLGRIWVCWNSCFNRKPALQGIIAGTLRAPRGSNCRGRWGCLNFCRYGQLEPLTRRVNGIPS